MSTSIHRGGILKNQLHIAFEGPRVREAGLPVEDLRKTLKHVQRAVRLMVGHLMGSDPSLRGRPPKFVGDRSALRLVRTAPGSLVAVLELPPPGTHLGLWNYGHRAVNRLLRWKGDQDPSLPPGVVEALKAVRNDLSEEIYLVRLRAPGIDSSLTLTRMSQVRDRTTAEETDATLQGRLMMVDWKQRTAQLHNYGQPVIRLRFDAALDDEMKRRATQYIEVRGRGKFAEDGSLVDFHVRHLKGTRSSMQPYDLDELLNAPDPKIFDPEKVVRTSEPFDVDEFMRIIREGRDA